MKIIYIFFLIITVVLSQTNTSDNDTSEADPSCDNGVLNGTICCHISCNNCGSCGNNLLVNDLCCSETIKQANLYCLNNTSPCIYIPNIEDPFSFTLDQIIIIAVIGTVGIIVLIYVCCCFRTKKPPLDYSEIIGKFD
jgi:hypothetical protein